MSGSGGCCWERCAVDGGVADHFVLSTNDDQTGWLASMGIRRSRWQPFLGIETMVAAVNSINVGTLFALVSAWFVVSALKPGSVPRIVAT